MLWVLDIFYSFRAGIDFRCDNLTSIDVRLWRQRRSPRWKNYWRSQQFLFPLMCCPLHYHWDSIPCQDEVNYKRQSLVFAPSAELPSQTLCPVQRLTDSLAFIYSRMCVHKENILDPSMMQFQAGGHLNWINEIKIHLWC